MKSASTDFWFLWLLSALWFLVLRVVIVLGSILLAWSLWYLKITIFSSLRVFCSICSISIYIWIFTSSNFFGFFTFLIILAIIQLSKSTVISVLVTKSIVSIYLLELRTQALLSIWRRKHDLKFLYSFSDFLFIAGVVSQSDAKLFAHVSQNRYGKVAIFVQPSSWTTKWCLEGERIYQLELLPHYHTARRLFLFLYLKIAVIEVE